MVDARALANADLQRLQPCSNESTLHMQSTSQAEAISMPGTTAVLSHSSLSSSPEIATDDVVLEDDGRGIGQERGLVRDSIYCLWRVHLTERATRKGHAKYGGWGHAQDGPQWSATRTHGDNIPIRPIRLLAHYQ